MRVLAYGGRYYADAAAVAAALARYPADAVLVHGAASGADQLAASVWESWGRKTEAHPADWEGPCRKTCMPGHRRTRDDGSSSCPAAGPYRNQEMLNSGLDAAVCFPGGRGTADMTKRLRAAGIDPDKGTDTPNGQH